jgi:hypothetical protein
MNPTDIKYLLCPPSKTKTLYLLFLKLAFFKLNSGKIFANYYVYALFINDHILL